MYPGLRLTASDLDNRIDRLLSVAESALADSALALALFEEAESSHRVDQTWENRAARRLPFLYARLFVYSLNRVRLILTALSRLLPSEARAHAVAFKEYFPNLAGVRDSSEHIDERLQRRALKNRKRVPLSTPGVVLESLFGKRFINTTADEPQADVEVSATSVERAVACVQGVLDALPWTGPARIVELP